MSKADTKSTTPRPKRRASRKAATMEEYAALSFQPIDLPSEPVPTITEWMERAKNEYAIFRLAIAMLGKDDVELAASVEAAGFEPIGGFLDQILEMQKTYKAGYEVCKTTHVRVTASMARVFLASEVGV
jgi:hypothetical protein